MLVPLHAFVAGDTLGVVVLVQDSDTVAELARAIQHAAATRVAPVAKPTVYARGRALDPRATVSAAGLTALERVDLRGEGP
jgi:hypothetical protein